MGHQRRQQREPGREATSRRVGAIGPASSVVHYTARTDGELLRLAAAGDAAAYDALVRRHRAAIYLLARTACGNDDDAAGVMCDAFVRAFRAIGQVPPDWTARRWFYRHTLGAIRDIRG